MNVSHVMYAIISYKGASNVSHGPLMDACYRDAANGSHVVAIPVTRMLLMSFMVVLYTVLCTYAYRGNLQMNS